MSSPGTSQRASRCGPLMFPAADCAFALHTQPQYVGTELGSADTHTSILRHAPPQTHTTAATQSPALTIRPCVPLSPQPAQVLWTYGDRSSCDFFCYHGFVLPGNAQEEVQLWGSVAELAEWFCREHGLDDAGGRLRGAAGAVMRLAGTQGAGVLQPPGQTRLGWGLPWRAIVVSNIRRSAHNQ